MQVLQEKVMEELAPSSRESDAAEDTRSSDRQPESGDPLLKQLVDLGNLGWQPELLLFSNGELIRGRLISAALFKAALAESIRRTGGEQLPVDSVVATAIAQYEPSLDEEGHEVPEPRFIHLADVRIGDSEPFAPFMRLRLPAVSGFWITGPGGDGAEDR